MIRYQRKNILSLGFGISHVEVSYVLFIFFFSQPIDHENEFDINLTFSHFTRSLLECSLRELRARQVKLFRYICFCTKLLEDFANYRWWKRKPDWWEFMRSALNEMIRFFYQGWCSRCYFCSLCPLRLKSNLATISPPKITRLSLRILLKSIFLSEKFKCSRKYFDFHKNPSFILQTSLSTSDVSFFIRIIFSKTITQESSSRQWKCPESLHIFTFGYSSGKEQFHGFVISNHLIVWICIVMTKCFSGKVNKKVEIL